MDYDYFINAMKIIAVADAFGYLNPPRVEKTFWIHPFNLVWESNNQFINFMKKFKST